MERTWLNNRPVFIYLYTNIEIYIYIGNNQYKKVKLIIKQLKRIELNTLQRTKTKITWLISYNNS